MTTEQRSWRTSLTVETRAAGEGLPKIRGLASVFRSPSYDLGGYVEYVDEHAFDRTLKSGDVVHSYFNHSPHFVLGRTDNGTMKVWTDRDGLRFEVQPPPTAWAADLVQSLKRADVRDASFAFHVVRDQWRTEGDKQIRTLLDLDLIEAGPVTNGAYGDATSGVRALLEARGLNPDQVLARRPAGRTLTVAEARAMMAAREARWAEQERLHTLAMIRRAWGAPSVSAVDRDLADLRTRRARLATRAQRDPGVRWRTEAANRAEQRRRAEGALPAGAHRGLDGAWRAAE